MPQVDPTMDRITIERADNGYIVRYDDPTIQAKNREEDSKWEDPEVRKVYADEASMIQDLASLLPGLKSEKQPDEAFASAFNEAAT